MSCYHPLLAMDLYGIDWQSMSEKDDFLFPGSVLRFDKKGVHRRFKFLPNTKENRAKPNTVEIPCRKCIGCRLDYSRRWANRCMMEAMKHDENWFLTLTYDNLHLPIGKYGNATLSPDDLTNFMKRLRKKFGDGIKYFACGEYGSQTMRPHYHLILFGLHIDDISEWFKLEQDGKVIAIKKKSKTGEDLFNSQTIRKVWSKGDIYLGSVSWNSCNYVARYVLKKQQQQDETPHQKLGIEKEFLRMSRRPGIGYNYFMEKKAIISQSNEIYLPGKDGYIRATPTGYFGKLLKKENEAQGVVDHVINSQEAFRNSKLKNMSLEKFSGLDDVNLSRKNKEESQIAKQKVIVRE